MMWLDDCGSIMLNSFGFMNQSAKSRNPVVEAGPSRWEDAVDTKFPGSATAPDRSAVRPDPQPLAPGFPAEYNAAHDLIERNLAAGRGDKPAFIDDDTTCTYRELAIRVNRFAHALRALDQNRHIRVIVCGYVSPSRGRPKHHYAGHC